LVVAPVEPALERDSEDRDPDVGGKGRGGFVDTALTSAPASAGAQEASFINSRSWSSAFAAMMLRRLRAKSRRS